MKNEYKRNLSVLLSSILLVGFALGFMALPASAAQPDAVTVDVFRYDVSGAEVHCGTFTITKTDGWYLKIPSLDKYDDNGNLYDYVVIEHPIDGYISTIYYYINNDLFDYYCFVVNQEIGDQEIYVVTFDGNGGTVLSVNEKRTVTAPATTLGSNMPPNPTRSGYTFKNWNTQADGSGTVFTSTTTVTENITVYAQWTENKGSDPKGRNEYGVAKIVDEEEPEIVEPYPDPKEWALLNLILSVLSVILAIVTIIRTMRQKKRETWTKKEKQRRFIWLSAAIAVGIAGVVLFLLTQDMSQQMVLFDKWTIAHTMISIGEIRCLMTTFKNKYFS
jgi:uncharacterized repeat protein (TIGR02543 family)